MKICLAQIASAKGDLAQNLVQHIVYVNKAVALGAELVVFPELSLTGYYPSLAAEISCYNNDVRFTTLQEISDTSGIMIGVGVPTQGLPGVCISMIIFQPHTHRLVYSKKYLHADEEPFFVSGENIPIVNIQNTNVSFAICYELSVISHIKTAVEHMADIYIASVVKSPQGANKASTILRNYAKQYQIPVLMVNAVGLAEDTICGGISSAWSNDGSLVNQLPSDLEGILFFDTITGSCRVEI
jgi:predicted amidohydrolase